MAEHMEEVAQEGLISHGVVTIGRRQSFAGGRAARVLLARIVKQIADVQRCPVAQDVGGLGDEFVVVVDLQYGSEIFRLQSQRLFHLIDARASRSKAAGGINAVQDERRIKWRFGTPLALIARKQEILVLSDRPPNRAAELVKSQRIETGRGKQILSVHVVIAEEFIDGAVEVIAARFCDGIHYRSQVSAIVTAVRTVNDPELLHPVLRRTEPLHAGNTGRVIGSVQREK